MSVEVLFRTSVLNRHSPVYVTDPTLSEIRSTPCACGSLCAHREPHAQGVLYVCCKQTLKTAMDALVTGFCCSSTVTIINLLDEDRAEPGAAPEGKVIYAKTTRLTLSFHLARPSRGAKSCCERSLSLSDQPSELLPCHTSPAQSR